MVWSLTRPPTTQFAIIERFHCLTHSYVQSIHPRYPRSVEEQKGGEKGGRERKKEFEREWETSERKKNKSSSLLAVDNVGVRLHRDTYRNELVYRRCVKLQRKRGRGRRSHGNWSEKLVEECWKEKGDEESWKYWKESTVPRLSITSSHFIIFCAHISVFGVDSVQSTGHDESAYLEVAIKLTIGRKREVLLISFPSPLSSPPLVAITSISSLIRLCCRVRVIFSWKKERGEEEGKKEKEGGTIPWNIKSFTLRGRCTAMTKARTTTFVTCFDYYETKH